MFYMVFKPLWREYLCAEGGQFLGKRLICGIDRDAGRVETEDSDGVHVIENQPVGPVRACPSGLGYAVRTAPVGILLGSVKDDPDGGCGLRRVGGWGVRNNAETGKIVGFKL